MRGKGGRGLRPLLQIPGSAPGIHQILMNVGSYCAFML